MSNFNLKAKNKKTGTIKDFTVIDKPELRENRYYYTENMISLNFDPELYLSEKCFDELYEPIEDATKLHLNGMNRQPSNLLELLKSNKNIDFDGKDTYISNIVFDDKKGFGKYLNEIYLTLNAKYSLKEWIESMPRFVLVQYADNFLQQELERIKNNFMTEFTDPDTGMLDIGKYDHEEIINFFNKEIK